MKCLNMRETEWTLLGLAECGVLGEKQTDAVKQACMLIASMRQILNYKSEMVCSDDVINELFIRTGGER